MSTLERRHRKWQVAMVAAVVVVGVALAACSPSTTSSSTTSSSATSSSATSRATGKGTTVQTTSSPKFGTILVTSSGMTLYLLTADSSTSSVCTGSCVSIWPPLTTATGNLRAANGVKTSLLGTITRSNGSKQVTYDGHPLYTYAGDSVAGQTNGEGIASFGGTWYVLDASGKSVTSATSSTTTTGSSGYSY